MSTFPCHFLIKLCLFKSQTSNVRHIRLSAPVLNTHKNTLSLTAEQNYIPYLYYYYSFNDTFNCWYLSWTTNQIIPLPSRLLKQRVDELESCMARPPESLYFPFAVPGLYIRGILESRQGEDCEGQFAAKMHWIRITDTSFNCIAQPFCAVRHMTLSHSHHIHTSPQRSYPDLRWNVQTTGAWCWCSCVVYAAGCLTFLKDQ